jgi:hypothetical protein
MRSEATNEPFDDDLEQRGCDKALENTHHGSEKIIHASSTNLEKDDEDEGRQERDKCRQPDWDDLFTEWIRELRIDDFPVHVEERE